MKIAVILAVGAGTRMKSGKSKVLHEIMNKPMIEYIVEAAKEAGTQKNIIIAGENKEDLMKHFKSEDLIYKIQDITDKAHYGTGYAVGLASDEICDEDEVLILLGDTPLLTGKTLKSFFDFHEKENESAGVLTFETHNPTGYGRAVKDEFGQLVKIVEEKDATEEEKKITELNSGVFIFKGKDLKSSLGKITTDNAKNEYYLTDAVKILNAENKKVKTFKVSNSEEFYGVNSKLQLAEAENIMRRRINENFMISGVILRNPENIFIDSDVKIGKDTIIESGAVITGNTEIGENSHIMGDSRISNCKIGSNVVIKSSYLENSTVEDNVDIGPYSHLRPGSHLKEKVHIGNFVEVKNSTLGEKTKAGHLAYIGDADLGSEINVGCGVIFVNYDGEKKHRTNVGNKSFIGSNSNMVAPVTIGEESFIAAGSTITRDVGAGDLAIGRSRQENKPGWVKKNKEKNGR